MADEYIDILIRISPRGPAGAYPIEAELSDGSSFCGSELRIDQEALLRAELDPAGYGQALFGMLFTGLIRSAYDKATGSAEARTAGRLRVRLLIDEGAAELHALPWERLYHTHHGQLVPLAASVLTPFSRYTRLTIAEPRPVVTRPIGMLVVIANPSDLPPNLSPVAVEQEIESLRQALGDLGNAGQIRVTLLPGRSGLPPDLRARLEAEGYQIADGPASLGNLLRCLPGCHVLHFLGHGGFRRQDQHAFLWLEAENGSTQRVVDEELVERLASMDSLPHLVFMAACKSAERSERSPLVGLGPRLVSAGVPAVVAMQDAVPIDLARQLTGSFYRYLMEHGRIDQALNQARLLLFERDGADWAIPVLFMRLAQGQLFTADPVRTALQTMLASETYRPLPEKDYLPIEALYLAGPQDPGSLERLGQERAPALNLVDATLNLLNEPRLAPRLVAVIGTHGMGRSVHLRQIGWKTALASLAPDTARQLIPAYVDLQRYPSARAGPGNPIEQLILESLRPFWPDLTAAGVSGLLRSADGPALRLLIDGSDDLSDRERRDAWRAIQDMARDFPRHDYLLTTAPAYYDSRRLKATDLLVVQSLVRREVENYLNAQADSAASQLRRALAQAQLFDLAAFPWLLLKLLDWARAGNYPRSRADVLQNLVEDALADMPTEHGMRARANQTLYALAWEIQQARSSSWPVSDAFRTMAAQRGNREYSLETFYDALVECGLIARVGQESLRFARLWFQAYCCARALLEMEDSDRVLDDITATLGRLTRLRWWEDTLIILSGLMPEPSTLISKIVYGATLTEGEQVFLAARCLLENSARLEGVSPQAQALRDLLHQIADALIWRLDGANERRTSRRRRAAQLLGQLSPWYSEVIIPALVRVANQKVNTAKRGEPEYDFSSVRMTAAVALERMLPGARDQVAAIDPQLAGLLQLWDAGDVMALAPALGDSDVSVQAIAAFALGDIQSDAAVDALIRAFLEPDRGGTTRWAITDTLALLDPARVADRAILPLLDEAYRSPESEPIWPRRQDWYERLIYLIGRLRVQAPATHVFLERCLHELTDIQLKAKAIQSLGWMYERKYRALFEEIAVGDFQALTTTYNVALPADLTAKERIYLRRIAIEALGDIGNWDSLARLRDQRASVLAELAEKDRMSLEQAFYWASEEINWRLSFSSSYSLQ